MNIEDYEKEFDRVKSQVKKARQEAQKYKGPCEKCKFFKRRRGNICINPLLSDILSEKGKIIVQGLSNPQYHRNYIYGRGARLCGVQGRLFEPRSNIFCRLFGKQ